MKKLTVLVLLVFSVAAGYQGYVYSGFYKSMETSEKLAYEREYMQAMSVIDELRGKTWYRPIAKYAFLDIWEIDKELDYQKGWLLTETGELAGGYALFERCSNSSSPVLASACLYQQGNIAFYQGSVVTAENKWKAALAKNPGGHDYDAQVNLEKLLNQQSKANAAAAEGIRSYRRGRNPNQHLRPPGEQKGAIKP